MDSYPYNFLIVTHDCSEPKCLNSSHILSFFGPLLQKEDIIPRYQVAKVHYCGGQSSFVPEYPLLHLMVQTFPSIFFFTEKGWNDLCSGNDIDIKDIKLYSATLVLSCRVLSYNHERVIKTIPLVQTRNTDKEITLQNLFAWICGIKCCKESK
jgi:hypothetical protein